MISSQGADGAAVDGEEGRPVLPGAAVETDHGTPDPFQARDHAQPCGLAAAGRAEQGGDALAGKDFVHFQPEAVALHAEDALDHGRTTGGQDVRVGVFQSLHVVVNGDGQHLRAARDVAADHQDDAEFSESVRKGQNRGGQNAGRREWKGHREEAIQRAGPQGGRRLQRTVAHGGEGVAHRLHREGQGIDAGADDQSRERECQRSEAELLREGAKRSVRAEHQQQIEAENSGWKDEGQRDDGLQQQTQAAAGARQPPREGDADEQKDDGGRARQQQSDLQGRYVCGADHFGRAYP